MKNLLRAAGKNRRLVLWSGLFLAALCTATSATAQSDPGGKTFSQKKFERKLDKHNTVLLDVRTMEEYEQGHIPGAILADITRPDSFMAKVDTLDKKKTYLLYCRSGKRSAAAMKKMSEMGFTKLAHLEGGFSNWKGKRKP